MNPSVFYHLSSDKSAAAAAAAASIAADLEKRGEFHPGVMKIPLIGVVFLALNPTIFVPLVFTFFKR